MSGLSAEDREALMDACPVTIASTVGDHEDLFTLVEAIVARHVTAALTDLDERCARAERLLDALAEVANAQECARIRAKRSGVALVRDYIRAAAPPT